MVYRLRRHLLPIASLQDNAYIIEAHNVNSVFQAKISRGSVTRTQQQTMPKRIILNLKNPTTQQQHSVVVNVPHLCNRGRPRILPEPTTDQTDSAHYTEKRRIVEAPIFTPPYDVLQ